MILNSLVFRNKCANKCTKRFISYYITLLRAVLHNYNTSWFFFNSWTTRLFISGILHNFFPCHLKKNFWNVTLGNLPMFHVYTWKWITSEYNTCWGPTTSPEDDTVRVALSGVVKRWSPSRCLMASTIESRLCLEEEVVTMYDLKRDSFFLYNDVKMNFFYDLMRSVSIQTTGQPIQGMKLM